jgi:broad specificity phosphatase PhoE
MPRFYLVRHGHAAAGFGEASDPGLDPLGREEAKDVAVQLAPKGPLPILTSPLARAREAAGPLASSWRCRPVVENAVGEIPAPPENLAERAAWLAKFLKGAWGTAGPELADWRTRLLAVLLAQRTDTVIFSHYDAINAIVGAAIGDSWVVVFSPDNCSITIIDVDRASLRVVEKGREAPLTRVN